MASNRERNLSVPKFEPHGIEKLNGSWDRKRRFGNGAVLSVVQAGHTGRLAAFTERASRRGVAMFMAIGTVITRKRSPQ